MRTKIYIPKGWMACKGIYHTTDVVSLTANTPINVLKELADKCQDSQKALDWFISKISDKYMLAHVGSNGRYYYPETSSPLHLIYNYYSRLPVSNNTCPIMFDLWDIPDHQITTLHKLQRVFRCIQLKNDEGVLNDYLSNKKFTQSDVVCKTDGTLMANYNDFFHVESYNTCSIVSPSDFAFWFKLTPEMPEIASV